MPTHDDSLLRAALVGYEAQLARLTAEMAAVQKQLGRRGGGGAPGATPRKKSRLSAAARKRIAAAQRKRWAEYRKKAQG